ncbi:MAG: phosphoribosylaminoimidazolesuccinocarboxamide synthase [Sinobacteraceae bacterium]|nr:phosphoribosylaminoimidazolesuccinocarboxamide synthase [Nevskiaceae bacterium]
MEALRESSLKSLPLVARGKVRDLYALGDDKLLILATDRLSAFDVILPQPIPGKGKVLTAVTRFWMQRFSSIIPNHELEYDLASVLTPEEQAQCEGRNVVARRLKALPVEAVARGYLSGSGWKDYQATGHVCGVALPSGLRLADKLPEPIFTPAYKAPAGQHDANIDFQRVVELIGEALARQVRDTTLRLYREAAEHAASRGILVADTKFEFGVDEAGTLVLIDEVLTPDSSRFWPAAEWQPGRSPPSFDKQYVRDYLETLDWDKTAPGPELPAEVVKRTAQKYHEAQQLLTEV